MRAVKVLRCWPSFQSECLSCQASAQYRIVFDILDCSLSGHPEISTDDS